MNDSTLNRFLGGRPLAVLIRLVVISSMVGALMAWLNIDALGLLSWIERTVAHLWATGFDILRQIGRYILAGAALVVPIWLLTRVFTIGDMRRSPGVRWRLPGAPPEGAGSKTDG